MFMSISNSSALFRKKLCEKYFFVSPVLQSPHEGHICTTQKGQAYFHLAKVKIEASLENQYNGNYSLYEVQTVCVGKGDQYSCK